MSFFYFTFRAVHADKRGSNLLGCCHNWLVYDTHFNQTVFFLEMRRTSFHVRLINSFKIHN